MLYVQTPGQTLCKLVSRTVPCHSHIRVFDSVYTGFRFTSTFLLCFDMVYMQKFSERFRRGYLSVLSQSCKKSCMYLEEFAKS